MSDSDLEPLATRFANTVVRAAARGRALSPDAPLVFEVLAVFDGIATIFAEDVAGDADYITVDPAVTVAALNAARDAVAAAYARPVLSKSHYQVLMAPWRAVFGRTDVVEPDFGPGGAQIRSLLTGLSWLASRCHDDSARRAFDEVIVAASTLDADEHAAAVDTTLQAAVLLGRRRLWTLLRCNAAERLYRPCPARHHRRGEGPDDEQQVVDVCGDAAGALLVSPVLDPLTALVLTTPVSALLPTPGRHCAW